MKITGTVVHGKHIGRTIGFPTANIEPLPPVPDLPADGVYAAMLYLDGAALPCMVNQGRHPTLPEGPRTIEAHVLDFSGDLYGRQVEIEYLAYLRPERRFESLEALTRQLERDRIETARICSGK